ncbi:ethanolamine kinase 1-like [Plakobranchus ocellatus]|uniref:ethanolamine kinase n=1 Tax=Plakobranchus ocellatus TaxID=259542 RepID=A0AAV4E242_9GAST|nr:ethanolamine kinase 1-like [Plakobranchus ocellatus]
MDFPNVSKLDISLSDANFQEDARKIIGQIHPDWDLQNLKFKVFTDGITNKLLGCYQPGDFDNLILVRVNGEGSGFTVDRRTEQEALQALHAAGCAPPVHCMFNNGMAYGFFPGQPLDERSVRIPHIQGLIAKEMVRLHQVTLPSVERTCAGKPTSQYAAKMVAWLNSAPTHFDNPAKQKMFETEIPSKDVLRKELDTIVDELEALQMDVVFSHNDLLLKNIIYNEKEDTIRFIDYEYAFYNYEAFDIGNHFTEYAGMDEVDYNLYPSREEQLPWLRNYLKAKAEVSETKAQSAEVCEEDVETLYVQVNKCACAAHFLWAVWALIQAAHSIIDFDYLGYSNIRIKEYFRRKEEFFKLKVPS